MSNAKAKRAAVLIPLALWVTACCGGMKPDATSGCTKDTDCKNNRVCVSGTCVDGAHPTRGANQPAQATAAPTAAAPAQPARGNDGLPADIPSGRSAVPTLAEWNGVQREITVARSTPLSCETKMLREWLRVSCRGKTSTGGTPQSVRTAGGCTGDTYTFSNGGVTSLVTPVLAGRHCEADFEWSNGKQRLHVDWPNGAPRPTIAFRDPLRQRTVTTVAADGGDAQRTR